MSGFRVSTITHKVEINNNELELYNLELERIKSLPFPIFYIKRKDSQILNAELYPNGFIYYVENKKGIKISTLLSAINWLKNSGWSEDEVEREKVD